MALPVHWHSIPSTDAVLNKKHIYHEKPMGMSVAEAKHVRAAVRQTGVIFQFGTQQRSDLKFRWACELARNGRLGKLKEIQVAVPGGITSQEFPKQPVPEFIDWERWVGPAAFTDYNVEKTKRHFHENISNFSLGMLSCWGIHHLDIAQWGNGTDDTGPVSVGYEAAEWPQGGTCDNVLGWRMRFEYAKAAPITFVNETRDDIAHGIRFIGENGWVHVRRGDIKASDEAILRDPASKAGVMPIKLPISLEHTANFIEAVRASGAKTVCDVETAVRSDTLCQLAAIAVKTKRALKWDPAAETIQDDAEATKLLEARPFRGDWKLPALG
jgi:predicted dehydrogenase